MDRAITITLLRSEILYDIELVSYAVGQTVMGEDEQRSLIMDVSDDGKIDKTTLNLNKAWGELLNEITGYTKAGMDVDVDVFNILVIPEKYEVRLCVPDSFTKLNAEAVKNSMHAYLANKALEGWFAITKKDEVQYYANEARLELSKVKRFLNTRIKPLRIKMNPF